MPQVKRNWTPEEDSQLRRLYPQTSYWDISQKMGISLSRIRARARQLKLVKTIGPKQEDDSEGHDPNFIEPELLRDVYDFDVYAYHITGTTGGTTSTGRAKAKKD